MGSTRGGNLKGHASISDGLERDKKMQQMMSVKRGKERERETDRWVCIVVSKCEVCVCAVSCATHQLYWDLRERERERDR